MNVLDTFSLKGKTVLLTGGAGLYGQQITEAVLEAGATLFVAARNHAKLETFAATLAERGMKMTPLSYDQGEPTSVESLFTTLTQHKTINISGKIDVLINNSVARPMESWDDPLEQWEESMRVNATGLFQITRLFGNHMAENGGGSIINIGSIQGCVGPDYTLYEGLNMKTPPDYFFHKGGMCQLTRFVASKLGPAGVRCNTLIPGGFYSGQDPVFVKRYNAKTMLGHMADATALKGAVVFLASDASSYITATDIPIDGGYLAK